jgi:hypothetical protein
MFWKTRIMLFTSETLLLCSGDNDPIPDQGCRAVVIERRNAKNRSAQSTPSVFIACSNS